MNAHMNSGKAIRQARVISHMSQAHLAQAAAVSESTVRRAEKGEAINAESMRALCAVLQIQPQSIRKGATASERRFRRERVLVKSPWEGGPVVFEGLDGREWPYQPMSTLKDTFIDLVLGEPGSGKSTLVNAISLSLCGLLPHCGAGEPKERLPYITTLGYGDHGWLATLRSRLPADRQHEVQDIVLDDRGSMRINPFDTHLGFRRPTALERAALVSFLTALWSPEHGEKPDPAIMGIAGACIDLAYERRDDRAGDSSFPKRYAPGAEPMVDEALERSGVRLPQFASWWSVVDALYESGDPRYAEVAQRRAVPSLVDVGFALGRIALDEASRGTLERMTRDAIEAYPILRGPTNVDVGGARVISVDLSQVAKRGGHIAGKKAAVMTLLARIAFGRHLYLNKEGMGVYGQNPNLGGNAPIMYLTHHAPRVRQVRETLKRLVYDDLHRCCDHGAVRQQVLTDTRESRKWGIGVSLVSQLSSSFCVDLLDMASGRWQFISGDEGRRCREKADAELLFEPGASVRSERYVKVRFNLKHGIKDAELTVQKMPLVTGAP